MPMLGQRRCPLQPVTDNMPRLSAAIAFDDRTADLRPEPILVTDFSTRQAHEPQAHTP